MYEYRHGGNAIFEKGGEKILDLSANINPLGLPPGAEKAIREAVLHCTVYPDHSAGLLREKIAAYEEVPKENIFCGNGASDIIFRLALALKPERVFMPAPTFSDYERAVSPFTKEIIYYFLRDEKGFMVNKCAAREVSANRVDMAFICNPNNPTGILTERETIEEILQAAQETDAYVAVDECFMDFTLTPRAYTAKPLLKKYKNLIILKAFTKTFALPGIRLGYALCADACMADKLQYHGADWPVSNLAQAAGVASLQNADSYMKQTVSFVSKERDYLKTELQLLGFKVFDSQGNYVFFKSTYPFNLWERLNQADVRIRCCDDFKGLSDSYYRAGISQYENNRRFIQTVREVLT